MVMGREPEIMERVFSNIRTTLALKMMTIAQLADSVGIERKTFYVWEDKLEMPASALIIIAKSLEKTVDDLVNEEGTIIRRECRGKEERA